MDFVGSRYYMLNRVMLSTIGLWPYQNVWHMRIQRIYFSLSVVSCIIVQVSTFITSEFSLDLLLEVLSCTIPCFIVILKYTAYCVKIKSMRMIMEMIKYDWSILKDRMESEIIKKYTYIGAFYAQLFALVTYSVPIFFACLHFIPNLLDLVAPLNHSRPHHPLMVVEYFVDFNEYFHPILLHLVLSVFTVQIILMSTTSIYVAFIQHVCGMFEIASYRIEHALGDYKKRNPVSGRRCVACTRIISAVDIHRRAIESVVSHRIIQDLNIIYMFLQI
ncbi:PREDICTED: uncharacterized protein LOC105459882 [Wasmannia auropunctata]|uniref:uncharacterized protein LOC105459882 n=1 Tax=Wasmannia auropunctata TaxID=64793 RepID=UPI0005EF9D90|nr:PREDICTED: uncharacterized protein LOC105459882 [Wasmannia auropunctata]